MNLNTLKFARLTGLYQILNPNTTTFCGCNIYHIVIVFFGSYMLTMSMLFPIGLFYLRNDIIAFMYYMGSISNLLLSCYKMGNILYYFKDIWKCIADTSFNCISYKHYDRNVFKKWQTRSLRVTYIYIVITVFIFFCWIFSPCVMNNSIRNIRNTDGSYSKYRMNIFNLYLIASDETYNLNFYVFYVIEIIINICYLYFTLVCDILMILIYFEISSGMETICIACESLNYNTICSKNDLSEYLNFVSLKRTSYRFVRFRRTNAKYTKMYVQQFQFCEMCCCHTYYTELISIKL